MTEILSQGPIFLVCLAFLLGVVVIIHELGHYWMGRWYGAAVESFSVGFGKPIFETKDKNGTRWRVNWIPLGGFVKFVGESQLPSDVGKVEDGPVGKPYPQLGVWARVLWWRWPDQRRILCSLCCYLPVFFAFRGVETYDVYAHSVAPDYPAEEAAGMQPGDVIRSIDGKPIQALSPISIVITSMSSGRALDFEVQRGSETLTLSVTPRREVRENQLGQIVPSGHNRYCASAGDRKRGVSPLWARSAPSAKVCWKPKAPLNTPFICLGRIVTGKEPLALMSGPVAIGDAGRRIVNQTMGAEAVPLTTRLSALGWSVLQLCALISIGIGFFNLLPLPVLDGGHLVFNAYEFVTGKVMPEKVQEVALMAGLGLLLTMFVFITWGDVLETGLFERPTSE